MENKNILVTGGCGFIGSNFINYLIDNFDSFNLINLDKEGVGSNKTFVKPTRLDTQTIIHLKWDISHDLLAEQDIIDLPFDYLFHFAAESHVDRSISSPRGFITSNVMGTMQLLENAHKMGVKRIINVSTDEIYGSKNKGSSKETDKYNPSSVYSASKASTELLCNAYIETYSMDIVTTRCSNNYGANQFEEKLIPKVIKNALAGEKIPIYDEGLQSREWTHVDDHIKDLLFVAEHGKKGQIYNVGKGYEIANIDLVKKILEILDKPEDLIEFIPNGRKGHDFRYSINTSKLKKLRQSVLNNQLDKNVAYDVFTERLVEVVEGYL